MSKLMHQTTELIRTARTRKEVEREIRKYGFDDMLAAASDYTRQQFAAARNREGGVIPVVIPAHNEGGPQSDLPATLLSVARSEAFPVVVNNRSTDDTVKIATRMGAVVIDAPVGRKMAATKAGISYVRHELHASRALFTDADTLVTPTWAGAMALGLENGDTGNGAALFGGSLKWHGPSMAADLVLSGKAMLSDHLKRRSGRPPVAHGHNYGLKFDSFGAMEGGINALPSDLFVQHGRADDAAISEVVADAGANIMGPTEVSHYVLTRGDRVTSLRDVVALTFRRVGYNELVMPSYEQEYPELHLDQPADPSHLV